MSSFKREKKKEEDTGGNPHTNLDKTVVLQEARYFNDTPLNPRKCCLILTKILHMLNQGEQITTQEATEVFFATTKLFQSKDVMLRRMVYLCIKDLSNLAKDMIIVTSSLIKDMTGKQDLYRAPAIRALCSISDSTMLQALERYMRQAIIDKNPAVSSAALVSSLHLSEMSPDFVRRWANDAQEVIGSENAMVSYHALGVVTEARKYDKMSVAKLVVKLSRSCLKSPYTICFLIRVAAQLVESEDSDALLPFIDFIESCLRHKSEMVIYEAAHALINLKKTAKDLAPAVSVLQLFCGSSSAARRLAGAKTLAKLTAKHPSAVAACNVDLENLISDPNRSVATLAVTTLLATSAESSIDKLLKQISSFVYEIPDEFKITVVKAIGKLCSKFPRKHQVLVAFLAGLLRNDGGLECKAAIAEVIIALVEEHPEVKEIGLAHLCEFIEDCEHTTLAIRILHLLGREGPKSRQPSRYIRFIYNRVFLESGPVRAAAVSSVAQFGAQRPELLPNISVLLQRCQLDEDDEVRDRAVFYSAILDSQDPQLINDYIINVPKPNPVLLEKALKDHLAITPDEYFNMDKVPTEETRVNPTVGMSRPTVEMTVPTAGMTLNPLNLSLEEFYTPLLATVPGIERLQQLFKTVGRENLTEEGTEYTVQVLKHVYARHLVLQFDCRNNLRDQVLENVYVKLDTPPEYEILSIMPISSIAFGRPQSLFVVLKFPSSNLDSVGTFSASLEFTVKDCDPRTNVVDPGDGYADSFLLEDFNVEVSDQFRIGPSSEDFNELWKRTSFVPESHETYTVVQNDVQDAAEIVCRCLGISSKAIVGNAVKEVRACGIFRDGGAPIVLLAKLAASKQGITMKLTVRSPREDLSLLVLSCIN